MKFPYFCCWNPSKFSGFPWFSTMVTPFFMAKKGSTQWPLRIRCAGSLAMIPMWPPSWAAQWSAEGCWNELQKKGAQNGDAERDAVLYSLYDYMERFFSGIFKHGFAKVFLCLFCSAGVVHWFNCLIYFILGPLCKQIWTHTFRQHAPSIYCIYTACDFTILGPCAMKIWDIWGNICCQRGVEIFCQASRSGLGIPKVGPRHPPTTARFMCETWP